MFIPVLFISLNAFPQNSGITIKKNKPAFPQLAYSNGIMEIQLGKLAQRKASSYKVKEFGERIVRKTATEIIEEMKEDDRMPMNQWKTISKPENKTGGQQDDDYIVDEWIQ